MVFVFDEAALADHPLLPGRNFDWGLKGSDDCQPIGSDVDGPWGHEGDGGAALPRVLDIWRPGPSCEPEAEAVRSGSGPFWARRPAVTILVWTPHSLGHARRCDRSRAGTSAAPGQRGKAPRVGDLHGPGCKAGPLQGHDLPVCLGDTDDLCFEPEATGAARLCWCGLGSAAGRRAMREPCGLPTVLGVFPGDVCTGPPQHRASGFPGLRLEAAWAWWSSDRRQEGILARRWASRPPQLRAVWYGPQRGSLGGHPV
mmetsp:Transcript_14887/g.35295  ORF Transcript_14887/g.35295 Transcript_14887/m.35295 type:complete len:256 (-) Transcript_14887:1776-2543(-)